jgi:hypothetical protein
MARFEGFVEVFFRGYLALHLQIDLSGEIVLAASG